MSIFEFSLNQSVAATVELGIQPGTICLTMEHHNHRVPSAGQEINIQLRGSEISKPYMSCEGLLHQQLCITHDHLWLKSQYTGIYNY